MADTILDVLLNRTSTATRPSVFGPDKDIIEKSMDTIGEHPAGKEALDNTTAIFTNKLPTDIVGWLSSHLPKALTDGGWPKGKGRSFTAGLGPLGNYIFMAPDDGEPVDTLAHELGHVQQKAHGLPIRNDKNADYLIKLLLDKQQREYDAISNFHSGPPPADIAAEIQNSNAKLLRRGDPILSDKPEPIYFR